MSNRGSAPPKKKSRRRKRKPAPVVTPFQRFVTRLRSTGPSSGPVVARTLQSLVALVFLIAWLSLGAQLDVLLGSRGLLPIAPFLEQAGARGFGFFDVPTLLWWGSSDRALSLGVAGGIGLAVLALFGIATRACLALSTLLYMGYAVAGRTFFSFQWDNLLLETGLLTAILPRDRAAPWAHTLVRILVFKLYFESGVAKWQSPLGDWHDGSAMTFYYETAPLPTRLAWHGHWLPRVWHHFESIFTLFFELALPFAIFGPRPLRRIALVVLTGFQVINVATANYGFFSYLATVLHVALLDDSDLLRLRARLRRVSPRMGQLFARVRLARLRVRRAKPRLPVLTAIPRIVRLAAVIGVCTAYVGISLVEGLIRFANPEGLAAAVESMQKRWAPFRLVNNYHLFAAITRTRIEPEIQWSADGVDFKPLDLRYKPGDPMRPPPLVAPHQPRLDFQLWFYGLSYRRNMPPYVTALLDRLCHDPTVVASLFAGPMPEIPVRAVRVGFYDYRFAPPEEHEATGVYWRRVFVSATPPVMCRNGGPMLR